MDANLTVSPDDCVRLRTVRRPALLLREQHNSYRQPRNARLPFGADHSTQGSETHRRSEPKHPRLLGRCHSSADRNQLRASLNPFVVRCISLRRTPTESSVAAMRWKWTVMSARPLCANELQLLIGASQVSLNAKLAA
jgi:hypothetical protein